MNKCLIMSTFTPSARTWWLCSVFPFFGNPVHIHYMLLYRTGWVHLMLGTTQWTIPQRLPDSLCTLAYCYISVAQGMIVIVPCRANTPHKTYGKIRPGNNYQCTYLCCLHLLPSAAAMLQLTQWQWRTHYWRWPRKMLMHFLFPLAWLDILR